MDHNIKSLFPGYFKEDDNTQKFIWKSAVFVFDTNILLNLYRYSNTAREDFFKILTQIQNRVWLPHQVVDEYFLTRISVIKSQAAAYDSTMKEMDNLELAFENNKQHPFVKQTSFSDLKLIFEKLKNELEESKLTHTSRLIDDPIKDNITSIFGKNIGLPNTSEELTEIFKKGEGRYNDSVPPGYKDADKSKSDNSIKGNMKKFGDLIIWLQILSRAKKLKNDIIFITDDNKEDWWSIASGKTISPRPELIKEFKDETGCNLLMYRAHTFVNEAKNQLGSEINPDTLAEIQQIQIDIDIIPAIKKYKPLYDIVCYLNALELTVDSNIPSERTLSSEINHNRSVIREHLGRLESFGYIEINHGKATKLIRQLPDLNFEFDNE